MITFEIGCSSAEKFLSWFDSVGGLAGELARDGAVLCRTGIRSPQELQQVGPAIVGAPMDYVAGASPRTQLGDNVFTSTEFPSQQEIALHNELSYTHTWPARLAFTCVNAAETGGATTVADGRAIYRELARREPRLVEVGIAYKRNLYPTASPGSGWHSVFRTQAAEDVNAYAQSSGILVKWRDNLTVEMTQVCPSSIIHPEVGEAVWFGQPHLWHPSNAGAEVELELREAYGEMLPMDAMYADGSPIEGRTIATVREVLNRHVARFDWLPGDVLLIDNMLQMHGRESFTGKRRILVSMGSPVHLRDVSLAWGV